MTDFEEWTKTELIQEIVRLRMRLSQRNDKLIVKRDGNLATDPVVRPKNVAADLVTATSVPAETTVDDQSESQQYWYNLVASRCIRHHADHCVLLFTLLAQLVVYVSTCYPTIAGGDSAEIVAAACSKGAFECFVIKKSGLNTEAKTKSLRVAPKIHLSVVPNIISRDLGVAHPPGYPLWIIINALFMKINRWIASSWSCGVNVMFSIL